jgi:acetyl-CoA carboxylase biotin carboxyl carrier protein
MASEVNDLKRIGELIQIMEDHDLAEIQIEHGDEKICLKRRQPVAPSVTALPMFAPGAPAAAGPLSSASAPGPQAPAQEERFVEIKAPLVGTFYQAASPDSDPYVEIGAHVEPQTVVCIVEAMKVMNEIKADVSGTIVAVLATNGQAVQYGQALFKVRPD